MSEKSERINLVVSPQKKEKWDEYADEHNEYSSTSDLIRTSVAREMAGQSTADGLETDELELKIAKVVDGVDELNARLENVENRLRSIENEATRDPDVDRLTGEVFNALPDERPGSREWSEEGQKRYDELTAAKSGEPGASDEETARKRVKQWEGSADDLAVALDEPEHHVREALEKLLADTPMVRQTDDGRYYKGP